MARKVYVKPRTKLGCLIRKKRFELGLSQKELALQLGIGHAHENAIEVGRTKGFLSSRVLEKIIEVLKIRAQKLKTILPKRGKETELSKLIIARREKLGLSRKDLAQKSGLNLETISKIEFGHREYIYINTARKLSQALEIELLTFQNYLFHCIEQKSNVELGKFIRFRRKELMMTQEELAHTLRISKQEISHIELGITSLVNATHRLDDLATALHVNKNILYALKGHRRLAEKKRNSPLGKFFTEHRIQHGLTQKEVTIRTGLWKSVSGYGDIETGLRVPSNLALDRIASVLNCTIPDNIIAKAS